MSFAQLVIPVEMLEGWLHLSEHGIQIRGAEVVVRNGHFEVALRLIGDGLPDCEVVAHLFRTEDGREVLKELRPVGK